MPVSIAHMRDLMLPGMREAVASMRFYSDPTWQAAFTPQFVPAAPHIWVPKLSLPMAVAAGAAAMIIKNPVVTRRFWSGWVR